jgi:RimJ/RimL family protein N-acetyltransferase
MNRDVSKKAPLRRRILPALFRQMTRIGIRIEPFVTVFDVEAQVDTARFVDTYRFGFLTTTDVEDIVQLEPESDRDEINAWFQEGKLCFGAWDDERLVAKMWCDPHEFNFPPNYRKLASDEVYLFAAYADCEYRGQGLAPLTRAAAYEALREQGYRKFYSYTDYFNTAARRFKAKLGAREQVLRLHIELFRKWSKTITLRRQT